MESWEYNDVRKRQRKGRMRWKNVCNTNKRGGKLSVCVSVREKCMYRYVT